MATVKLLEIRRPEDEDNGAGSVVMAFLEGISCKEVEIEAVDYGNPKPLAIKALADAQVSDQLANGAKTASKAGVCYNAPN